MTVNWKTLLRSSWPLLETNIDILKNKPMKPQVLAVDFDGTVVTHEFPYVGKEIGAEQVLKKLLTNGHKIVLNTMRGHSTLSPYPNNLSNSVLDDAKNWFKERNIPLYGVNEHPTQKNWTSSPKVYANQYIDDAAVGIPLIHDKSVCNRPFVDWVKTEALLQDLGLL
jgi:hypothetical protein